MTSNAANEPVEKPWLKPWQDVVDALESSAKEGLSAREAQERLKKCGRNRLRQARSRSAWSIFIDQLKNVILLLLAVATILACSFGQWLEGISILVVIVFNTAIGFFTELKAVRSMEALQRMSRFDAKVIREGQVQSVPAERLVPGDLVPLEGGDLIPADLRLTEASRLEVDESALTGESMSVGKTTDPLRGETPLPERNNMAFSGTAVTGGSGHGVVVTTGMATELGKVASLAEEAEEEVSPLEKRLTRLGYRLIGLTLVIAAMVAISGVVAQRETLLIIETAIALAVAAIPEGLPVVATLALARGMWRMNRRNALINRLSAVETLGATNLIFTDKTGTLTENEMTVTHVALPGDKQEIRSIEVHREGDRASFLKGETPVDPGQDGTLREILETGVLCNNASLDPDQPLDLNQAFGDPIEVALLGVGRRAGLDRDQLLEEFPETREEAFDPDVMMMATLHKRDGGHRVAVKGAPETIIDACTLRRSDGENVEMDDEVRRRWRRCNEEMAEKGLRILALAAKDVEDSSSDPYAQMAFLGLVGMLDPPREDVEEALASCRNAGIRVVMVTGDHRATARHVGRSLDIIGAEEAEILEGHELKAPDDLSAEERKRLLRTSIYARVTPEQKLDLIELHQKDGAVVAMTGDGVNDAPALKKADIGIAMGRRGTQVAREAADMILKDDAFPTIVVAVQQGRAIFDNIRKFILYLLSGNVSEIMIVGFALLAGAPLPLLPLQILYLNMISDVFPALALGVGKGDPSKMKEPPRDAREPVLTNRHWIAIGLYGLLIAAAVLGGFAIALEYLHVDKQHAVTVSFLSLAFARLWHVFNMRDRGSGLFVNPVTRNPFVWAALGLCTALLLAGVYLPGLSLVLALRNPGLHGWGLILGASLTPLVIVQIIKSLPVPRRAGSSTAQRESGRR